MRVAAKNRQEIWLSLGAALLALIFATPMPMAYGNVLMLGSDVRSGEIMLPVLN